ncbi:MAG TPA: molybdopterin molybdenumtransferase MoeA, partial [Proteobacteria bacterium]|nr:molybdopterin molybdenumtransferase MoeA [Pseudomonadota bacterium]
MIPIEEAKAIVLESVEPLEPKRIDLDECIGLVAAEDIASDRDYPPFDKAMMDGYAVCAADLAEVPKRLPISGEVRCA